MSDVFSHLERLADIVINGRKADPSALEIEAPISMTELVRRKVSVVRCGNKRYTVTVVEVADGK